MKNPKQIGRLYLQFLKIGCFTFGGGWSILAQMRKSFVEERQLITNEDLLDIVGVGRSLPGTMIGNVSLLFGYRVAGALGGIACVFGLITAPLLVIAAITYFYTAVSGNPWIAAMMTGVRAAVVPILLDALINMFHNAFRYKLCYLVAVFAFAAYAFFNISGIWIVLFGIACGVIICNIYERRQGRAPL